MPVGFAASEGEVGSGEGVAAAEGGGEEGQGSEFLPEGEERGVALTWGAESKKWVPQILSGRKEERTYEFEGAERMPVESGESPWGEVGEESRFFRVKVGLP